MQLRPEDAAKLAGDLLNLDTSHGTTADSGLVGVPSDEPVSGPGARLGKYRITRLVGRGGMGDVYEAEQESPRRRVALKVVRTRLLTPELRRRFEHEVRILGSLQHPGIAQIYEAGQVGAGETNDGGAGGGGGGGTPFFAMEFVEGEPLTKYASSRKLSVRERLELFLRVCQAVEHAHQRGIIHRDLKPANILVAPPATSDTKSGSGLVDQLGQPKVLDFGVARATGADMTVTSVHTEVGKLVGTLPYMSPEQALGDPRDLDTRSDVYALGVVLYELLSGKLPYEVKGDGGARVAQALRVIREVDPTPLSSIDRVFRGDLETIVSKALEKERERRYQSVGELAGDVRRYLADEPIVARRAGAWYELRRFARRNRGLVVGVAISLAGLLCSSVLAVGYAISESKARLAAKQAAESEAEQRRLADERGDLAIAKMKEAERQASVARAVNEFVLNLLSSVDPKNEGRDVTVASVLAGAPVQVDRTLAGSPEVAAEVLMTVARMHAELGDYQRAAEIARAAAKRVEAELGAADPITMRLESERANIERKAGHTERAASDLKEIYQRQAGLLGRDHYDTLVTAGSLVVALLDLGRYRDAEELSADAISRLERTVGAGDSKTKQLRMNRAMALDRLERWDEAEEAYRSLLADLDQEAELVEMVNVKQNLATTLRMLKRYEEAEGLLTGILPTVTEIYGADHPATIGVLNNLAVVQYRSGNVEGAVAAFGRIVEALKRVLGADHPDVSTSVANYASVLREAGRLDEAIVSFREAVDIKVRTIGGAHLDTLGDMRGLAGALAQAGRTEEALGIYDKMVAHAAQLVEGADFWVAAFGVDRGRTLAALGRVDEAEEQLLRSLETLERIEGGDSPKLWKVTSSLVDLYKKTGRDADADRIRTRYPQSVPPKP